MEQQSDTQANIETQEATTKCEDCQKLELELTTARKANEQLEQQLAAVTSKLDNISNELEREVRNRCELEQRFTEEAKMSTDQIGELVAKSDQDDETLAVLRRKFDSYTRETSAMLEKFTVEREALASQLVELRLENDELLEKLYNQQQKLSISTSTLGTIPAESTS